MYFTTDGLVLRETDYKDHDKLAFYAKAACDIQFKYPMGWEELNGIHNRTNHDLSRHQEYSNKSMLYMDPVTNEKYIPYVVEYSIGADRLMLAVLCEAYNEEKLENETRVVLKLHPSLAANKLAILPLMKRDHGDKANEIYKELSKHFMCDYDESGSIGKRYRRQDEIGTPFCLTVDDKTINNNTVTIRFRDSMEQITLSLDEVKDFVLKNIQF